MNDVKSTSTLMSPTFTLASNDNGKTVGEIKYRGMIGSLLYFTTSQLDILFSICKCARFKSAPNESHLTGVNRIIRYLIKTTYLGTWYLRSDNFELKYFLDVDYVGDKDDRKSISGFCQLIGNSLIS